MSTRYLIQKIFRALITICIIVTFVFVALRMSGDAALQIYGPDASAEAIEALRETWGLNKPIWKQYLIYVGNIFHGDLGQSYMDGRDAVEVVMERVPKTLSLMWITAIVTFLIGIPAGIYSALHHRSFHNDPGCYGFECSKLFSGCAVNSLVFSDLATASQCRQRIVAALHYAGHHDGHGRGFRIRTVYAVIDAGGAQSTLYSYRHG